VPDGRWPTLAGPRGTYRGFELLGRTFFARTPLAGAGRETFWGPGPFVCAVLLQIPIASTATNQSAENFDGIINVFWQLNITNVLLLQLSTGTALKLFNQDKLFAPPQAADETTLPDSGRPIKCCLQDACTVCCNL